MRRMISALICLTVAASAVPGCGSSGRAKVTGRLLKGGVKYAPPQDQKVAITLVAVELKDKDGKTAASNEPFQATMDPAEGTFEVPGPEGDGIPPGKYRVAVVQLIRREVARAKNLDREADMLKNQFGPSTSPIVREVAGSTELVIDLDKPTGP